MGGEEWCIGDTHTKKKMHSKEVGGKGRVKESVEKKWFAAKSNMRKEKEERE